MAAPGRVRLIAAGFSASVPSEGRTSLTPMDTPHMPAHLLPPVRSRPESFVAVPPQNTVRQTGPARMPGSSRLVGAGFYSASENTMPQAGSKIQLQGSSAERLSGNIGHTEQQHTERQPSSTVTESPLTENRDAHDTGNVQDNMRTYAEVTRLAALIDREKEEWGSSFNALRDNLAVLTQENANLTSFLERERQDRDEALDALRMEFTENLASAIQGVAGAGLVQESSECSASMLSMSEEMKEVRATCDHLHRLLQDEQTELSGMQAALQEAQAAENRAVARSETNQQEQVALIGAIRCEIEAQRQRLATLVEESQQRVMRSPGAESQPQCTADQFEARLHTLQMELASQLTQCQAELERMSICQQNESLDRSAALDSFRHEMDAKLAVVQAESERLMVLVDQAQLKADAPPATVQDSNGNQEAQLQLVDEKRCGEMMESMREDCQAQVNELANAFQTNLKNFAQIQSDAIQECNEGLRLLWDKLNPNSESNVNKLEDHVAPMCEEMQARLSRMEQEVSEWIEKADGIFQQLPLQKGGLEGTGGVGGAENTMEDFDELRQNLVVALEQFEQQTLQFGRMSEEVNSLRSDFAVSAQVMQTQLQQLSTARSPRKSQEKEEVQSGREPEDVSDLRRQLEQQRHALMVLTHSQEELAQIHPKLEDFAAVVTDRLGKLEGGLAKFVDPKLTEGTTPSIDNDLLQGTTPSIDNDLLQELEQNIRELVDHLNLVNKSLTAEREERIMDVQFTNTFIQNIAGKVESLEMIIQKQQDSVEAGEVSRAIDPVEAPAQNGNSLPPADPDEEPKQEAYKEEIQRIDGLLLEMSRGIEQATAKVDSRIHTLEEATLQQKTETTNVLRDIAQTITVHVQGSSGPKAGYGWNKSRNWLQQVAISICVPDEA